MTSIESSVGRPVRGINFFDRDDERRMLWQHLRQSHVLLLAPRRVGKTSLLMRLCDEAPAHGHHAVYLSVADARSEDDVRRKLIAALAAHPAADPLWRRLQKGPYKRFFSRLKARLDAGPLTLELGPDDGGWATLAEATADAIDRLGEPWLVLLDELPIFVITLINEDKKDGAAHLPRTRAFLNWFRALRSAPGRAAEHAETPLRWVVAGSIGLDAVVSRAQLGDTINDMRLFALGAFNPATADTFLAALGDSYGLALDPPTRARLMQRAGWLIPFYLQILFSRLHDIAAEESLQPSAALVDRVVDELLTPTYRAYFDYWRQRLTAELGRPDDQRALALLAAVAEADDGLSKRALDHLLSEHLPEPAARDESLRFLLEVLENDGYLVVADGRYRFRSELLREYWRRRVIA